MIEVKTEDAVGFVLLHDITRIVKGQTKGVAFKKGHIITQSDVPLLKDLGKFSVFVGECSKDDVHEDEAALRLATCIQGENISLSPVNEGKIELISNIDGYLKINADAINSINEFDNVMVATKVPGFAVKKGDKLAGTRIIPLFINNKELEKVISKINSYTEPIVSVLPFVKKNYAVVTIGNEVATGRIKDTFTPVIEQKLSAFGAKMIEHKVSDDKIENITSAINSVLKNKDVQMVFCTGGMSVDPDDRTPASIKSVSKEVITYGAPSLPGAMFMLSYLDGGIPICGLPGCVMFHGSTIFDWVLPKLLADIKVEKSQIKKLGVGGMCSNCKVCHFPNCSFLKAV